MQFIYLLPLDAFAALADYLPIGLRYYKISDRTDLHSDSAGTPCCVILTAEQVDGLEPVPREQWGALGFTEQKDIDTYAAVAWLEAPDPAVQDVEFQAALSALIADKYGPESAKAAQITDAFSASMAAIGISIKPVPIKGGGGDIRVGGGNG